jgi:hypothetical protein
MAEGRLELVDKTVQTIYKWVNELADQIGWHDRNKSFRYATRGIDHRADRRT